MKDFKSRNQDESIKDNQEVETVRKSDIQQYFLSLSISPSQTPSPTKTIHCVKSAHIRSYSGPHFPIFGQNTERYSVSLHIQSKCRKIWTRITPNTDTFYTVISRSNLPSSHNHILEAHKDMLGFWRTRTLKKLI